MQNLFKWILNTVTNASQLRGSGKESPHSHNKAAEAVMLNAMIFYSVVQYSTQV